MKIFRVDTHGNVGTDGYKLLGKPYLVGVCFYFRLERTFQFRGIGQKVLHGAELRDEFRRCFLSYARTARHIVGSIAFESQQVDYLARVGNAVPLAHLLRTAHLESLSFYSRAILEHVLADELAIVLIGCHHVGGETLGGGPAGQSADNVVGFVSWYLHHGNPVGFQNTLYVWDGQCYVLRLFVAAGLVFGISVVAECAAVSGVEAHGHVPRVFLSQNVVESVHEAEYGRSVQSCGCCSGRPHHGVVCAVDQCVCVEEEEFSFVGHVQRVSRLIICRSISVAALTDGTFANTKLRRPLRSRICTRAALSWR